MRFIQSLEEEISGLYSHSAAVASTFPAQEKRRANPTMERMRELLKTDEAKALYDQRKTIVEPVFGQIKQARGIREFRLRGFEKTKAEWKLICLTHNLLKLYRHAWLPRKAGKAA